MAPSNSELLYLIVFLQKVDGFKHLVIMLCCNVHNSDQHHHKNC